MRFHRWLCWMGVHCWSFTLPEGRFVCLVCTVKRAKGLPIPRI